MFSFVRNYQTIFQGSCIILQWHQQWMRVPVIPHFDQHLVLSVFWIFCHPNRCVVVSHFYFVFLGWLIDLREGEEGREGGGKGERERARNIDLLFHLLMHSLVDCFMYPDWESNLKPWHIWMMYQLSYQPGLVVLIWIFLLFFNLLCIFLLLSFKSFSISPFIRCLCKYFLPVCGLSYYLEAS